MRDVLAVTRSDGRAHWYLPNTPAPTGSLCSQFAWVVIKVATSGQNGAKLQLFMSLVRTELLKNGLFPKLLLALLWVLSTSDCTFTLESNTAPHEASTVLFRGCRVLQQTDAGTVCLPSAISQTIVWIADHPCDTVELAEDGTSVATSSKWIEGGCQLRLSARSTKQTSTYSIRERKSGKELWSLNYDRSKTWLLELTDRMWLRADPDLKGVVGTEPTVVVGIDEHPAVTVDRAYAAAVVLIRQGKIAESLRALAEVQELAMRLGYPSVALDAAFRRMTMLRRAGFSYEVEDILQSVELLPISGHALSRYLLAWNAGLLYRAKGDLVRAEQKIRASVVDEKKVSDIENLQNQMPMLASVLFDLNRANDAQQIIDEIPLENGDNCTIAGVLQDVMELQLSQLEIDIEEDALSAREIASIEVLLRKAVEARAKCQDATRAALLSINLAHFYLLTNRITEAADGLAHARARAAMSKISEMEALDIEARIAIKDGRPADALSLYDKLNEMSQVFSLDQRALMLCRVLIGKLEANQQLQQIDASALTRALSCTSESSSIGAQDRKQLLRRLHSMHVR